MSMKDYLTEKMLLNTAHGTDCTLEVCFAGEPDGDELICKGAFSDCMRQVMTFELPMTGDAYFSLTTDRDNYCGYDFEELAWKTGYEPEHLESVLTSATQPSLESKISNAEKQTQQHSSKDMSPRKDDMSR